MDEIVQDNLISTGFILGVALLSSDGNCSYITGDIAIEQDWEPFLNLFTTPNDVTTLHLKSDLQFIVFRKTECSVYGISEGTQRGLVVCSYPHGVIVCLCSGAPNIMNRAIPLIEKFVEGLR